MEKVGVSCLDYQPPGLYQVHLLDYLSTLAALQCDCDKSEPSPLRTSQSAALLNGMEGHLKWTEELVYPLVSMFSLSTFQITFAGFFLNLVTFKLWLS